MHQIQGWRNERMGWEAYTHMCCVLRFFRIFCMDWSTNVFMDAISMDVWWSRSNIPHLCSKNRVNKEPLSEVSVDSLVSEETNATTNGGAKEISHNFFALKRFSRSSYGRSNVGGWQQSNTKQISVVGGTNATILRYHFFHDNSELSGSIIFFPFGSPCPENSATKRTTNL